MLSDIVPIVLAFATLVSSTPFHHTPRAALASGITNDSSTVVGKTFDYVICGGGLTGLTVASRLTEDPDISVLVIEVGYDNHEDHRVSDVRTYGQAFGTELDHNIKSTPVPWQNGAALHLTAGKMLGGSGSLNGASWTKGPSSQYDLLPLLTGDDSWGWEPFNKYMLKSENFNLPEPHEIAMGAQYEAAFHGTGGPVEVSFAAGIFGEPQLPALLASEKVWEGLSRVDDAAAGNPHGTTIIPNMVDTDESQNRSSPFTAYAMKQIKQRSNFHILTGHRVIELVWKEGQNMVADGVHFQACQDCPLEFVHAKREVLLAAGSLQSPQILELSGVGDPKVLAAAGIPLKVAAPGVGKHMQEQTKNSIYQASNKKDFDGSGPPSAIAFPNVEQMLKDNTSATYDWVMSTLKGHAADLEAKGLVANKEATLMTLQAQVDNLFKTKAAAAEVFFFIVPSTGQIGIDTWNLIILSRGTAHIKTSNPWDHPIVEPNYFGHPLDLMLQTAISKQSREVYQTEPLSTFVIEEQLPGTAVPADATEAEWEEWVKSSFTSVWHYISTLSMMKKEYGGVVDSRLKVYGIQNVRAIDASVLPIQLSAHLSSSLYGIAEKAAVMIKEDQ